MAGGAFAQSGFVAGQCDCPLNNGFVQVMTPPLARFTIEVHPGSWEHPLPCPFPAGIGGLPTECTWKLHPSSPKFQVGLVLFSSRFDMSGQHIPQAGRKHRTAVPSSLALKNRDLGAVEIDVLDPKSHSFKQSEAGTVQEPCDELRDSIEFLESGSHLVSAQDDWQARLSPGTDDIVKPRQFLGQNMLVEEKNRRIQAT